MLTGSLTNEKVCKPPGQAGVSLTWQWMGRLTPPHANYTTPGLLEDWDWGLGKWEMGKCRPLLKLLIFIADCYVVNIIDDLCIA